MSFKGLYQHKIRKRTIRLSNTGPVQRTFRVNCRLLSILLTKYDHLEKDSVSQSPLKYISMWITVQ